MGVMQAEFQEKRQWVTKPRFLEGLALVNVLPGATAVQLGIFLGYERGGWWGGLLAGLCFAAPAFVVMLALALTYAALGVSPILQGALYGLGPGVIGVMAVALTRLAPQAAPDPFAMLVLILAVAGLLFWRLAPLKAMLAGAVLGVVRSRLCELPALRAVLCVAPWAR
jgi:chromate transporter